MSFTKLKSTFVIISFLLAASCEGNTKATSTAFRVEDRSQLIGGRTAVGEVGDYMMQNDQIRIVIQDKTYNRGAGVFGGSLIDADLRHATDIGTVLGGNGNDSFGEMFPAFFLEMIDPDSITIISDGSDGGASIVEVKGTGGEFVTMVRYLNQLLLGSHKEPAELLKDILAKTPPDSDSGANIEFSTRYILEPGTRHLRIESKMKNISLRSVEMPPKLVLDILKSLGDIDLGNFRLPLGHILGFGALSKPFLPGLGFDIQQGLVEELKIPVDLPGFPGKLTPIVASSNTHGVNYGFIFSDDGKDNFVYQTDLESGVYHKKAKPDDMLYLFNASGFGGVFSARAPIALAPGFCQDPNASPQQACEASFGPCTDVVCEKNISDCVKGWDSCKTANKTYASEFTYTNYFILGDGDVSSIYDEMYKIRNVKTYTTRGEVRDEISQTRVGKNESILIYSRIDASCESATILSQSFTLSNGQFDLQLPTGDYCFQTMGEGRPVGERVPISIQNASPKYINLVAKSPAILIATTTDETGELIPFKVTLVGTHADLGDQRPKDVLVDLPAGDPWRPTDVIKDNPNDPVTRRFIEEMAHSNGPGQATLRTRPGKYQAYISRGMEYTIDVIDVELKPGETLYIDGSIERAIDTTGYLSGDFHIHASGSIDSGLDNNLRVKSIAAEGVEVGVSTEHNYVSDFAPYILRNNLQDFMVSTIGIELTTFEAGHFNAYPVNYDVEQMSRGSFRWQGIEPKRVFDGMRNMYDGENIIQVNHPRIPIMGYFEQHNMNAFDTTITLPFLEGGLTSALSSPNGPEFYTEVETANGRFEYRSTFSWDFDAIEIFNGHHIEDLRHYRMPYDKNALPSAKNALPPETRASLRKSILADYMDGEVEETDDLNKELAKFLSTESAPVSKEDIEAFSVEKRNQTLTDYVESRIPNENDVLCNGDSILKAGSVDDWYNILNNARPDGTYKKFTVTGNSDTHHDRIDEAGVPRNYFWVGDDNIKTYQDHKLVKAIKNHQNIVTNGPFVWFKINGNDIGSEINTSGNIALTVHIEAAPWVSPNRFRIIANGEPVRNLETEQDNGFWGWIPLTLDAENSFEKEYTINVSKDTWFVIEVEGDNSLFPVVSPQDIPPINFADAIGSLAGAFGFGGSIVGLSPNYVFPVTPFAITNPIWVVADNDGVFTPSNPPTLQCKKGILIPNANIYIDAEALRIAKTGRLKSSVLPVKAEKPNPLQRPKGENRDVRILFDAFGGHAH